MNKRLGSIILALLLVLSLCGTAFAAAPTETEVQLFATDRSGQTTLEVYLTAESVTNGILEITYNASCVSLVSVTPANSDWIVSVNSETSGVVSVAWIGSNLPTESTLILVLEFEAVGTTATTAKFSAGMTELYSGETELEAERVTDSSTVVVNNGNSSSNPTPPIIIPPAPQIPTVPGSTTTPEVPEIPETPFTDINYHWAKDYIAIAYEAGLVKGVTDTTYAPDASLTRAAFITLLHRLDGATEVDAEIPFTDVIDDFWYTDAIAWGYTNGIVSGRSETVFDPNGNITRQELTLMLMRYADFTDRDVSDRAELDSFVDANTVPGWSEEALEWAVAEGILHGRTGNVLDPTGLCTRAEAATILVRFAGL